MLVCDCPPCPSPFSSTVLADLQQAHLITTDEYTWLNDISGVVKLQITKSHEVMTETAAVMKRHGLGEESKLLSGKLLSLNSSCCMGVSVAVRSFHP